jgi:hypothetical protein
VTLPGSLADPQGQPVAGASIRAIAADGTSASTTTSDDGRFVVELRGMGAYTIEARAAGFADLRQSVVMTAGTGSSAGSGASTSQSVSRPPSPSRFDIPRAHVASARGVAS